MAEMPWILAVNVGDSEYQALRRGVGVLPIPCAVVERQNVEDAISTLDRFTNPSLIVTSFVDEVQTVRLLSLISANGRMRHIRIWVLLYQQAVQTAELCRAFGATACFQMPVEQGGFESRLQVLLASRA